MHSLQSFDYSLKCNSSAYLMCMHSHVSLYTPFFTPKNVAQLYNVNIHKSLVRSCVCLFVWGCPCIITSRYITLYTQTYYAAMPFLYHQSNSTYKRVLLFSLSLSIRLAFFLIYFFSGIQQTTSFLGVYMYMHNIHFIIQGRHAYTTHALVQCHHISPSGIYAALLLVWL